MLTTLQTTESAAKTGEQFVHKQNCVTLIKLVAAGDESASAQLFSNTSGLFFGLLLRILNHSQTTEEVLKQFYAEMQTQANRFDEEREKPLDWLITIAHRQEIARLSEITNKQFGTICTSNLSNRLLDDFNLEASASEHRRLVSSAINALSPAQREILELAYFSGMNESEIAKYLGHSVETVRLSLTLAMKKLSALFSFLDLEPDNQTN